MKIKLLLLLAIPFSYSVYSQIDFHTYVIVDDTGGTNNAKSVFAADLDGDGDMDMLSASANDNKIAWYENMDGQGNFGPQQIIVEDLQEAISVFAADLDEDGKMDVIAAGSAENKIVWYKNLGQGSFGPEQIISNETQRPGSVYANDMDNDGDMDVISTSLSDNKIAIYWNMGMGVFGPQQVISTNIIHPMDVSTGDINGDGYLDILSGDPSYSEENVVWFENNNGQGNFFQKPELSSQVERPGDAILMDVDNDGDLDIVVASQKTDGHKIIWFENTNGLGSFPLLSQTLFSVDFSRPETLYAIDIDNDNDMDLVVGTANNGVSWYENDGSGAFGPRQIVDNEVKDVNKIIVSDINNDGNKDILISAGTADRVAWYQNTNGQGSFGTANELADINSANGVYSIYSADMDNDGDKDILSALRNDKRIVWQKNHNGQGLFIPPITIANIDNPIAIFAADLDGDGNNDVLAAGNEKLVWYKNLDGNGNFGPAQFFSSQTHYPETIYAADIDNDGDMDVFSSESMNTFWYENLDGLGNFGPIQIISDQFFFSDSMLAEDIDNDGDKDLIACYWGDGQIVWFENMDGQGSFDQGNNIDTLLAPDSVYIADLDNDGDIDVMSLDYFSDEVMWYENLDGEGNFGDAQILSSTVVGAWSIYATDLDNDADIDILCAGLRGNVVVWFENNGNGSFSSQQVISSEVRSANYVFADDFNNDGKMDVVASSYKDDEIIIFSNGPLSVEENATNLFSTYPNPTSGVLTINSKSQISEIAIYNNLGQLIFTSEENNQIDISTLSAGIYFIKIKDQSGQTETKKVIKK